MKIYTLGNFDIQIDNKSIIEKKGYPYKTIRLFKYFMTFSGKKLLPENIIDDLWYDSNSADPKSMLRTQISRVRNMMDIKVDGSKSLYTINHVNGYYIFNINKDYLLDTELFETNILRGSQLKSSNPIEASRILKEGLELYKGQYLAEMEFDGWIIPIRNRYHRLYVQGLLNLIEIFEHNNMHEEIVELCEKAILLEPYDEVLNIKFMESLLCIGEKNYAINHYEYITSKMYVCLGIAPSSKMKDLYKKIKMHEDKIEGVLSLNIIEEELKRNYEKSGPVICEPEYFKLVCDLESRKMERNPTNDKFLIIITIYNKGAEKVKVDEMNKAMQTLVYSTNQNFRKGDLISQWNERQIICLLSTVKEECLEIIADRLITRFEKNVENKSLTLNIIFKAL